MIAGPENIFPWGRSFREYVRMFNLSAADLQLTILDCASGPASFNAEMCAQGRRVISCDPLYRFPAADIATQIEETFPTILARAEQNRANFLWEEIWSPEQLGAVRKEAMQRFLADFPIGLAEGRYLVAELPAIPFAEREFDLALCSHFLFTSANTVSLGFHIRSIREMARVAREARVFPLVPSFGSAISPYLAAVIDDLTASGLTCEVRKVPYRFQKGADALLRVRAPA